jgi:processive 1,2-diacylglycerol beta-glucosyltransferase
MKKILVFYASYGGGHLSAAKSIKNYLQDNYQDLDVELIDCVKYINKAFEKVTTTAYKEMAKKAPWVWGKIYYDAQKGPLAHISTRANSFMAIKLLRLLKEKKPDIIISTHPFGSQMCAYLKRKGKINCKLATILTDFKSHDQWLIGADNTDFFFVSNENMKQELIEKNINPEKIFVTGIPVRKEFLINYNKKEILQNLNFSENKKTILFFGGGEFGLGKNTTLQIFNCLVKNFPNTQIIAISGKNGNMKNNFTQIVLDNDRHDSVKILEYTDKVAEFMSISDLIVTKPGGLTTTESLVSNVPMVIINPIPGQEEENAEFLENKKVAKWIKKEDDIKYIFNILLNDENILNNMKQNTMLIAKPNSTADICKIVLL